VSADPFALGAGRVIGSTTKALHVKFEPSSLLGPTTAWIPRSVLHDDSEVYDALSNASGNVVVEEWFARKEGWVTE
jgi:hypothetical protein